MTNSEITNDNEWFQKLQAEAQKIGARVHLIEVQVDYTKTWHQVPCGPQIDEVVILFNWPKGSGSFTKAVKWGASNNLLSTDLPVIRAILIQKPNLNNELKSNEIKVTGTIKFTLRDDNNQYTAYCYYNPEQGYHMIREGILGDKNDWFAFLKKNIPISRPEGTIAGFYGGC